MIECYNSISLSSTQLFFLKVLSSFVRSSNITIEDDISLKQLSRYAHMHQVTPILYYQCKDVLTRESVEYKAYLASVSNYTMRKNAVRKFEEALSGIEFVLLKGVVVAEDYPQPAFRTMGDVDALIHLEERELVHERLINKGFDLLSKEPNELGCWNYIKNGVHFEIHVQALHEEVSNDKMYPFFLNIWDYVNNGILDKSIHFLLLFAHLKEHMIVNGAGFRQFMDIAVVTKNWHEINWDYICTIAEEIGIGSFLQNVLLFNEKWFGVKSPIALGNLDNNFYLMCTNEIFDNGVFGLDNSKNKKNATVNHEVQFGKSGVFKRMLNAIFLPYEKMISMSEYTFLKNRRFLLPLAWIYRWTLKWKKRKEIKNYHVTTQFSQHRIDYMKKWGLI